MPRRHFKLIANWLALIAACGFNLNAHAQYFETLVTPTALGDTEFDWGRDGISCPSCNFGNGNSRLNWTQRTGNFYNNGSGNTKLQQGEIYLAHIDPNTGAMATQSGMDEYVGDQAYYWNSWGNGPEWTFSTQNGQIVSQLVYSGLRNNNPAPGNAGASFATQVGAGPNTGWITGFFPGAITGNCTEPYGSCNTNLPEGSQCNTDPIGMAVYENLATPESVYTEPLSTATGTAPVTTTFDNSNGIGERFVPCTHWFLFQGDATLGNNTYQQVFFYDMDKQQATQLTYDNSAKFGGFMFRAPDFGGNYIMFTISNRLTIDVYEQMGTQPTGAPNFQLVNQIASPDPNMPYMNSPEPFIHCTPICTTYIFTTLARSASAQNGIESPLGLGIATLDPTNPVFDVLASIEAYPTIQRLDPEYFISQKGPLIYYTRAQTAGLNRPFNNEGLYYIDTQLGPPSGPCVGSSAEDGLLLTPDCINFLNVMQAVPAENLRNGY